MDAHYTKIHEANLVRDGTVLNTTGITLQCERQVLGISESLSEYESHWKTFLKGLKDRGMNGVQLVTSDDHESYGATRRAVLGRVPWQRYHLHL